MYAIVHNAGSIGAVPTNLVAQQNGVNSVLVSWTAPSSPPGMGYQIRIDSTNFSADINTTSTATSSTILLKPGVHNIRLKAPSQHYPTDEVVGPVTVTVKGMYVDRRSRNIAILVSLAIK